MVDDSFLEQCEVKPHQLIKFITNLNKLHPIQITGVMKILKIDFVEEIDGKKQYRKYEELLSEIIDGYLLLGRSQRRELDRLIEQTLRADEGKIISKKKRKKKK